MDSSHKNNSPVRSSFDAVRAKLAEATKNNEKSGKYIFFCNT